MSLVVVTTKGNGLRARAERLLEQPIRYCDHESFRQRGNSREYLQEPETLGGVLESWKPPKEMPAHLARLCRRALLSPAEERHRFRRMNYAKYRADTLRQRLNPRQPPLAQVERIEQLLGIADRDRNEIVTANIRLVMSIAKKFVGPGKTFDELLSEGVETLMRAVEKFDFSRGFRFSTYATTALRHSLHRSIQHARRDRERLLLHTDGVLSLALDPRAGDDLPIAENRERQRQLVLRLIRRLDARERHILSRRFGLHAKGTCQTLQSLAGELGVCKERVRQLEMRARQKLRTMSSELESPTGDISLEMQ